MNEAEDYRSKLRTPKKGKLDYASWGHSSTLADFDDFSSNYLSTPSPIKRRQEDVTELHSVYSPHKSGYLLRTPSPPHKSGVFVSPTKAGIKNECKGTPSPHKASLGTDLFGNRSLLENLPIPDWDDNFLDNFQEGLFGLANEDLEGLGRSPLKSPRRGQPLFSSPFKRLSPTVSPFKNPLLTSSPKLLADSPGSLTKTPGVSGRTLTRQRKLFLQSPERHVPSTSIVNWPTPFQFSSLDDSSSLLSDFGNETASSSQSFSASQKSADAETVEDSPVMPPIGWTMPGNSSETSTGKSKGKGKGLKHKQGSSSTHNTSSSSTSHLNTSGHKKPRTEPQFTLLRPHAEFYNSQICLRMTPRTPPNKMKISRDLSQLQTLPSREQLRIVRNRFRETLNRAVEQVIEKEKIKEQMINSPKVECTSQKPLTFPLLQPATAPILLRNYNMLGYTARKPLMKKKKR